MTNRRNFLAVAACTALCRLASAQQQRVRRIGFLALLSRSTSEQPELYYDAFVQGMRDLGYVEGKNLAIEWRFADGKLERLPGLAAELVRSDVEVIVTHANAGIRALQRATKTIPIVFAVSIDPVSNGFAASLARPGGNITGLALIETYPNTKRLELLKAMMPSLKRVAVLTHPDNSSHAAVLKSVQAAAKQTAVRTVALSVASESQVSNAFAGLNGEAQAMLVLDDPLFRGQHRHIAELALQYRVPTIAPWKEFVTAGGLMSFGQDILASYRRAAEYVDRILKGAKPADLPIDQPSQIELVINRKTAKQIGIVVPRDLLLRADRVID